MSRLTVVFIPTLIENAFGREVNLIFGIEDQPELPLLMLQNVLFINLLMISP